MFIKWFGNENCSMIVVRIGFIWKYFIWVNEFNVVHKSAIFCIIRKKKIWFFLIYTFELDPVFWRRTQITFVSRKCRQLVHFLCPLFFSWWKNRRFHHGRCFKCVYRYHLSFRTNHFSRAFVFMYVGGCFAVEKSSSCKLRLYKGFVKKLRLLWYFELYIILWKIVNFTWNLY